MMDWFDRRTYQANTSRQLMVDSRNNTCIIVIVKFVIDY